MKHLKKFNENDENFGFVKMRYPFRSKLLYKEFDIDKYEFYVDGSTGWGIIFPNGYMEVEEGPHESVGFMKGEINGFSINARGYDVPRIPGKYWMGEMSNDELSIFFDRIIDKYNKN